MTDEQIECFQNLTEDLEQRFVATVAPDVDEDAVRMSVDIKKSVE